MPICRCLHFLSEKPTIWFLALVVKVDAIDLDQEGLVTEQSC